MATDTTHSSLLNMVLAHDSGFAQRHPRESDQTYLKRLSVAVGAAADADEGAWNMLTEDAQTWNNDAEAAIEKGSALPECDGMPAGKAAGKAQQTGAEAVAERVTKKAGRKKAAAAEEPEEADETEEAAPEPVAKKRGRKPAAAAPAPEPVAKKAAGKKAAAKTAPAAPAPVAKKAAAKKAAAPAPAPKKAAAKKKAAASNGERASRVDRGSPTYLMRHFLVTHDKASFEDLMAFAEKKGFECSASTARTMSYWVKNTIAVARETGHWQD